MPSDPKRLDQVYDHIRRIQASDYPIIQGNAAAPGGAYRIVEKPWQELPEPSKLAILQEAVDWSGITNRDQAHLLLSTIDPGRITDTQRNRLIDMAAVPHSLRERVEEAAAQGRDGHRHDDRGRGR